MSRFKHVKYDQTALELQANFKERFEHLEFLIQGMLPQVGASELALRRLDEAYLWVGKAIRDDQLARAGPSEEERRTG